MSAVELDAEAAVIASAASAELPSVIAHVLAEVYARGFAAGGRIRAQENPKWTQPALYAACPGCGDNGDAQHISTCTMTRMYADAERANIEAGNLASGAMWSVVDVVELQLKRRGAVDHARIVAAVTFLESVVRS